MRFLIKASLLAPLCLPLGTMAAGTPAGTTISNTATLEYSVEGLPFPPENSNTATLRVDELIALTLTWQDASPVAANTPDTNTPLTFALTNTGNGSETFTLTRNNSLPGDQYDPLSSGTPIYIESNSTPGLQTGVGGDSVYTGSVTLPANAGSNSTVLIYVMSDTPVGLAQGNLGDVQLTAASATSGASGAALGTVLAGAGDAGSDAMVGVPLAQADATGQYQINGLAVSINKTLLSPVNPALLTPGAIVTYRLELTLTGTGIATNLVLSDPIPAGLSYVAGTAQLTGSPNCTPCTDVADADPVVFSANTLSATLGNITAPATFVLTFNAQLPN